MLVTGATGLIGSNVCEQFLQSGATVRALVRDPTRVGWLTAAGVEIVQGDLSDAAAVAKAAGDCEGIVHCAALVPGGESPSTLAEYEAINVAGTVNVLDGAEQGARVLVLNTSGAFDRSVTLHEGAAEVPDPVTDPYAVTKRTVHREVTARVAAGADIITVLPPATIGPAPSGRRAVAPPGFNSRIAMALRGEIAEFPEMPISVGLASDVARACVMAMHRGVSGRVYLPWGSPADLVGVDTLYNQACAAAGVAHRVRGLSREQLQQPEVLQQWGPAIVRSALTVPDPYFRNEITVAELDHRPTPLAEAIDLTLRFLIDLGVI
jgi:nucleoside-diphosphate-sugar epimerase